MPLRAREMSIAIASTSAPITTSSAPRKEAADQRATPATMRRIAGRTPIKKTAPPIARLPVICWPAASAAAPPSARSSSPALAEEGGGAFDRLERAGALDRDYRYRDEGDQRPRHPDQAGGDRPQRPALVFEQAHDQADRGRDRGPAADLGDPAAGDSQPVADARFLTAEDHVGAGGEADAEVEADEAEDVDAEHDQRDRAGQLVVVPEVQARAEGENRQQRRRHGAVEREADQGGVFPQEAPALLGQGPAAFDPAHRSSFVRGLRRFGRAPGSA